MSVNIYLNDQALDILKTNDLRILNFYLRYLSLNGGEHVTEKPLLNNSPVHNLILLKSNLTNSFKPLNGHSLTAEHLKAINQHLNQYLAPFAASRVVAIDQFDWLKESKEACLYTYLYLSLSEALSTAPGPQFSYGHTPYATYPTPSTHKEFLQNIIDYFDYYSLSQHGFLDKQHMDILKKNWLSGQRNTKIPEWLNTKQSDSGLWVWEYIKDYNSPTPSSANPNPAPPSVTIHLPLYATEEKDKILGAITALRLWNPNPDTKTLFFARMNRAWSQRKTRRSRENMKAINTYISTEAKKKLDSLVKYNQTRMNEMIEILILERYEKHKKPIEDRYGK